MADDLPPGVILPEVDLETGRLTVVILIQGPGAMSTPKTRLSGW